MAEPGLEELVLLEKLLGLPKGNKYGVQGERKVPVLQTNNGPGLTGLMTIAAHLVKQAKKDQLLGSSAEEKAVVQQWLEYRVTRVDGGANKDDTRIILKEGIESLCETVVPSNVYLDVNEFHSGDLNVSALSILEVQESCHEEAIKEIVRWHNGVKLVKFKCKDLNMHLEDKVYLAGNVFTLADILMYYGLHHVMVDLTVQEKEEYLNVSRWFNHIQHYPGVRQHLSNVIFIKNRLYTNAH